MAKRPRLLLLNLIITDRKGFELLKLASAVSLLILLAVSSTAFGHAGEVHTYLGTVTSVGADGSFVMKTTDGEARTVVVSNSTAYRYADGGPATAADVQPGRRVAAKIGTDGKTALTVKVGRK